VSKATRETRDISNLDSHHPVAGVADCGCDVTVSLHMTILGLVLGYLAISIEVPDTGLVGKYMAALAVDGGSGEFDNCSCD
jgi:hypothetical protein